jgi:hypothetical protein
LKGLPGVKRLAIATLAVGSLVWPGAAGAQTASPTLTLGEYCFQGTQYFDYAVTVTITGLDPGAPVMGSIDFPDGNVITGTISADATGTASLTAANTFPGIFTASITAPFTETKSIYIDCGRPIPTQKADCTSGGWRRYGFKSASRCFTFVSEARRCAALHYQSIDPPECPPRLPNE